jgi:DNA-binding NarL/FixJ family response regulator
MPIRVVIADSTSIHCELLADALKRDRSIEVVASVLTKRELLELSASTPFDIALITLQLDEAGSGPFDTVRELRQRSGAHRTILLMDTSNRELVVRALRAGVRGVFPKDGTLKMLCKCVRCVYEGQVWATAPELASTLDAVAAGTDIHAFDARKQDLLSKREREVVRAVAEGLTNQEIAERLGLSKHTIKNYLLNVFDKLGVSNRVELLFLSLSQAQGNGNGVETSCSAEPLSPFQNMLRGAAMESPNALLQLADCCLDGVFLPQSLASAYMWCLVAERSSHVLSRQTGAKKQELRGMLSREEIEKAEEEAQLWRNHLKLIENSVGTSMKAFSGSSVALSASA